MPKCNGQLGWKGCGAGIRFVRPSWCDTNMAIDAKPVAQGDVVLEAGRAVVLATAAAAEHPGPKFRCHIVTCPNSPAVVGPPASVGRGRPQHTRHRPELQHVGESATPTEMHLNHMAAGAFSDEVRRLSAKFIDQLREVHGARDVYEYSDVNITFNSFRRLYGLDKALAEQVARTAKEHIAVSEALPA